MPFFFGWQALQIASSQFGGRTFLQAMQEAFTLANIPNPLVMLTFG
jgi:hypothetical protein